MPYKISKLSNNKPLVSLATLVLLLFFAALLFIIEPATEEKLEKRTDLLFNYEDNLTKRGLIISSTYKKELINEFR